MRSGPQSVLRGHVVYGRSKSQGRGSAAPEEHRARGSRRPASIGSQKVGREGYLSSVKPELGSEFGIA